MIIVALLCCISPLSSKALLITEWRVKVSSTNERENYNSVSFVRGSDSKNDLVNKPIFTCSLAVHWERW